MFGSRPVAYNGEGSSNLAFARTPAKGLLKSRTAQENAVYLDTMMSTAQGKAVLLQTPYRSNTGKQQDPCACYMSLICVGSWQRSDLAPNHHEIKTSRRQDSISKQTTSNADARSAAREACQATRPCARKDPRCTVAPVGAAEEYAPTTERQQEVYYAEATGNALGCQ